MNSSEPEIILERRYGRNALGCGMVLMIIVFFVCMAIDSSIFFEKKTVFRVLTNNPEENHLWNFK